MEKTVVKVLSLIETLAQAKQPLGVTAVANALGFTKSNAHRLLNTLTQLGYVRRHDAARQYELTPKLWRVGVAVISRMDIRQVALPHMHALEESTGETVTLAMWDDGEVVYIAVVQSRNPVRAFIQIGDRRPAYCTATGRALLAYQPNELLPKYCGKLKRYTPNTVTSVEKLKAELALVRKRGYSMSSGEWRQNIGGVAAPIRSGTGEVVASVGLMSPLERLKNDVTRSQAAKAIVRCAADISTGLGYHDHGSK